MWYLLPALLLGLAALLGLSLRARPSASVPEQAPAPRPVTIRRPPPPPPEKTPEEKADRALLFHVFRASAQWYERLRACPGCDAPNLKRTTSNYRSYSMAGGGGRGLHDVTHRCEACGWNCFRRNVVEHHSGPFVPDRELRSSAEASELWRVWPLVQPSESGADGGTVQISEEGERVQILEAACTPAGRAACALASTLQWVAQRVPLDELEPAARATMRFEVVRGAVNGAVVSRPEAAPEAQSESS